MMTHTCRDCGVELTENNWQPSYRKSGTRMCTSCKKKSNTLTNPKHNHKRKWLDKVYIKKNDPLYDRLPAGRFITAPDGSIIKVDSVEEEDDPKGIIYLVTNPDELKEGKLKVGKTTNLQGRINGLNTARSARDFYSIHFVKVSNRHQAEADALEMARAIADWYNSEWFKADVEGLKNILDVVEDKYYYKEEQVEPVIQDLFSYEKTGT